MNSSSQHIYSVGGLMIFDFNPKFCFSKKFEIKQKIVVGFNCANLLVFKV